MRFVRREDGLSVSSHSLVKPSHLAWIPEEVEFCFVAAGRIKKVNGSLRGVDNSVIVVTRSDVVFYGPNSEVRWTSPLHVSHAEIKNVNEFILRGSDVDSIEIRLYPPKKIVPRLNEIFEIARDPSKRDRDFDASQESLKQGESEYHRSSASQPSQTLSTIFEQFFGEGDGTTRADEGSPDSEHGRWSEVHVNGKPLDDKWRRIIQDVCVNDWPWLVINPKLTNAILVAFEDRLVIAKKGLIVTGSFTGLRTEIFYFRDITGLKYNASGQQGVLVVLTPSYSGTINFDMRDVQARRNRFSDHDPLAASNTLPLSKSEYEAAHDVISELRKKISDFNSAQPLQTLDDSRRTHGDHSSLLDDLSKLSNLRESGALTEEEYQTLKARILGGNA